MKPDKSPATKPSTLLITPPMTQLGTPYPATTVLTGFLRAQHYPCTQVDLGLELFLELCTPQRLTKTFDFAEGNKQDLSESAARILALKEYYLKYISYVIEYLSGGDTALAYRLEQLSFLPVGVRLDLDPNGLAYYFGNMGISDRARFIATLFIEDLVDFIAEIESPHFSFSRYGESLAVVASSFDNMEQALLKPPNSIDTTMIEILERYMNKTSPNIIGFSVPFPGNLYGALRCAKYLKQQHPNIATVMGGGYINTELRSLEDTRIFKYIDYITFDDGEAPLLAIVKHLENTRVMTRNKQPLKEQNKLIKLLRTCVLDDNKVIWLGFDKLSQAGVFAADEVTQPTYDGLQLNRYLSCFDIQNRMQRLWSDGRWVKLTLAHGCYWKRCSFCDTSLDYIERYEARSIAQIVDHIEGLIKDTGQRGFHFVDEAAPPWLLRKLAYELLRRGVVITWWTNIRFERHFDKDLCRLLAASGCIAVSGGLEVASDRLLRLMNKGITIHHAARVCDAFSAAGIMVHSYLMYGFPTQTAQETIDSLDIVRQLFHAGLVQSGFWHRFALTAHSPAGRFPERLEITITGPKFLGFARNELTYLDTKGCDPSPFSAGLAQALNAFKEGRGFEQPLSHWFKQKIPHTTIAPNYIIQSLEGHAETNMSINTDYNGREELMWLGAIPQIDHQRGKWCELVFHQMEGSFALETSIAMGRWLQNRITEALPTQLLRPTLGDWLISYEQCFGESPHIFLEDEIFAGLQEHGLLLLTPQTEPKYSALPVLKDR